MTHTDPVPKLLTIDTDYMLDVLFELLRTPSPSGRTDAVMQLVGERLSALGLTFTITRRGILVATLPGERPVASRALVVHADTIGCMVKRIKDNGRLEVVPVGTHSARFAEGSPVTVFTDDSHFAGTMLPLKSSGHSYGDEVDTQGIGWPLVEVRIDEPLHTAADTAALGIRVGDFVALDAWPTITPNGYLKSRHLDDKAGVAACLAALKAVLEAGVHVPVQVQLLVTIFEEVGFGATHGLDDNVSELVAVDNAVVAPEQQSREETVNLCMQDMTGPFDYHLTRMLLKLADRHGVPALRDVFRHYRSDAAPALESGMEVRTALVGFGVDSSHGHERTHLDGLTHVAELLALYLQSDLTFAEWDVNVTGPLEEFPSHSVQPAEPEPEVRGRG